jgi:hypothetical protein
VLPLFVPLALVISRPLATWGWLDRRRLLGVAAGTAMVLLLLKGGLGYWTHDRDAREMAAEIREAVNMRDIDEIAFIDMRAFFGLTLYLDIATESVRIDGQLHTHPTLLPTDQELCAELAEPERRLLALKRGRVGDIVAAISACGPLEVVEMGSFHADGNELMLFATQPGQATRSSLEDASQ